MELSRGACADWLGLPKPTSTWQSDTAVQLSGIILGRCEGQLHVLEGNHRLSALLNADYGGDFCLYVVEIDECPARCDLRPMRLLWQTAEPDAVTE
jgi:hypothetical protein